MKNETQVKECQEALEKLLGKEVHDVWFKTENDCWRLYIVTDKGKLVMTFCEGWNCPVVEHRDIPGKD